MTKKAKKKQKKTKPSAEINFKEGDLVGAKIKGYPLWPGRIEKVDFANGRRKYTVRFFGSDDTSQSFTQIKLFKEFTSQEKAITKKGFQEALSICQEEYDSLTNDKKEDDSSTYQSTTSSPVPEQLLISTDPKGKEKEKGKEKKHGKVKDPETEVEPLDSPASVQTLPESSSKDDGNAKLSTTKTTIKQNDSIQPKIEGENVMLPSTAVMQTTIAKLKEKVAKKIKEKEARKSELKERRLHKKISPKLVVINEKLKQISLISNKLSKTNSVGQADLREWKVAVRNYEAVSSALTKCIKHFIKNKITPSIECCECHKTLVSIVKDLKEAQKNDRVPDSTKKELKQILKLMKNKDLRDFINDDLKNAMTERKENDAE